jgi:hypothetical protein
MEALQSERALTLNTITQKLLCFDANGINTFQGSKSGGMEQVIITNYVPYIYRVHCMAHRCNLVFQTLYIMGIVSTIEDLLQNTHGYFAHSPKEALGIH